MTINPSSLVADSSENLDNTTSIEVVLVFTYLGKRLFCMDRFSRYLWRKSNIGRSTKLDFQPPRWL
jgi:hypothetical protein